VLSFRKQKGKNHFGINVIILDTQQNTLQRKHGLDSLFLSFRPFLKPLLTLNKLNISSTHTHLMRPLSLLNTDPEGTFAFCIKQTCGLN